MLKRPLNKILKAEELMAHKHKGFGIVWIKRDHDLLESLWKNNAPGRLKHFENTYHRWIWIFRRNFS